MAQWKLGTGSSYAGISGFTWPANANPNMYDPVITKLQVQNPIPYTDYPLIIDQGTQAISRSVEGVLWSTSDIQGLAKQACMSNVDTQGRAQNFVQRLYINGTDYVLVRNGSLKDDLISTNPLGYPYIINFLGCDPFVYTDSPTTYSSANGGSPRSVASIANAGTAYCFPQFTILNAAGGSNITAISIAYGSLTLAWTGNLTAGSTLTIYQDYLESGGTYGLHAFVGTTETGTLSGNRFIIAGSASSQTIAFTFTGGSNGAICSVIVPNRRWG